MKIYSVKNLVLSSAILAASVLGINHCNQSQKQEEQRQKTEELRMDAYEKSNGMRFYVTEGISLGDIMRSRSIDNNDSVQKQSVQAFDTDNNKILDKKEAKIFNATNVFQNPENYEELVFRTKLKDGQYSDCVINKNNLKDFKYRIDAERALYWLNDSVMKNSNTKSITSTKTPKIVTKGTLTKINNKSCYTDLGVETFGKYTSNYISYWYEGVPREAKEYNYQDSTQIHSMFYYETDGNGKIKNKRMVKRYYDKEFSPDFLGEDELGQCSKYEKWEKNSLVKYVARDAERDSLLEACEYKNHELIANRFGDGIDASVAEYYQDGRLKYESYKTEVKGFGECVVRRHYYENGNMQKEILTTPEYNKNHIYGSQEEWPEPRESYEIPFRIREFYPNGTIKKEMESRCIDNHTYERDLYLVTTKKYDSSGKKVFEEKMDFGGYYRGG